MKKAGKRNYRSHVAAVFLDRDGTIIEDRGDLSDPSQVVFFRDTVSSLRQLNEYYDLFIVTNQSGVGRGIISMKDVDQVNAHIASCLARHGVPIAATYVCPHERKSGCLCIKPEPYFLKKAESEFGVDLSRSFVIGDHPHDIDFAVSAGATGIYVLSGHGLKHREEISTDTIITDGIGEAAKYILGRTLPFDVDDS